MVVLANNFVVVLVLWTTGLLYSCSSSLYSQEPDRVFTESYWETDQNYQITSITISPDTKFVVVGTADGTIDIFDRKTRAKSFSFKAHEREVGAICFSSQETFATVGGDGSLKQWSLRSGNAIEKPIHVTEGYLSAVKHVERNTWVAQGFDGLFWIHNSKVQKMNGFSKSVELDRNNKTLMSGSSANVLYFIDLESREVESTIEVSKASNDFLLPNKLIGISLIPSRNTYILLNSNRISVSVAVLKEKLITCLEFTGKGPRYHAKISSSGKFICTDGFNFTIWDSRSLAVVKKVFGPKEMTRPNVGFFKCFETCEFDDIEYIYIGCANGMILEVSTAAQMNKNKQEERGHSNGVRHD